MNTPVSPTPPGPHKRLGQGEFVAMIAMLFATIALSIDAMLPALPEIAAVMTPEAPNRAQFVVGAFFLGMGLGTIFTGPLSDAFGRKRVIMWGGAVYCVAAVICFFAQSFELFLAARVLQGIGAAGPRTVSMAMVRDLYKGREMARIMSFAMMIFMLVPAAAPLIGQGVIALAGWHAIFLVYVLFCLITMSWMGVRQPETLPVADRIPLSLATMTASARDLFSRRTILVAIVIQSLTMAAMVASISSIEGIFREYYGREASFPLWFALIAGLSGFGSLINSRVVMRMGMRRVITVTYTVVLALTAVHLLLRLGTDLPPAADFAVFLAWMVCLFGMMSLTMGNLNALSMEPVGHIAGFAASMITALATVLSVVVAMPIGQAFDGTPLPLILGAAVLIALSLALMRFLKN
ncbi:multidrug effflux MFS transporter [Pseudogemmobacter sonorensis]|uniref:multidrug effflux MFS transporter n=1 Tax=Pseudogemmobacter sonorensis TaxID=2989681 RepID=UPI0036BB17A4